MQDEMKIYQLALYGCVVFLGIACAASRTQQRGDAIEDVMSEMNDNYARLSQRISDLDRRFTEMDNSLFILNDLVDSNSQALKELKVGIGGMKNTRDVPAKPVASAPAPSFLSPEPAGSRPAGDMPAPPTADPYLFYRESYDHFRSGKMELAKSSFTQFLKVFPRHELSDNALYWLGECYYAEKDFSAAAKIFERVCREYQDGNKVPDALLKLGYSYLSMGKKGKAEEVLQRLIRKYPHSEAANKAKQKLRTGELQT